MIAKTPDEIDNLRKAGKILARVLQDTAKLVNPGVATSQLDIAAEKIMRDAGTVPAFLGYKPEGAK